MNLVEKGLWGKHHDCKGYGLPIRNKCFGGQAANCLCEGDEREKLRGLSPRANYTDRAAAAGRRS